MSLTAPNNQGDGLMHIFHVMLTKVSQFIFLLHLFGVHAFSHNRLKLLTPTI